MVVHGFHMNITKCGWLYQVVLCLDEVEEWMSWCCVQNCSKWYHFAVFLCEYNIGYTPRKRLKAIVLIISSVSEGLSLHVETTTRGINNVSGITQKTLDWLFLNLARTLRVVVSRCWQAFQYHGSKIDVTASEKVFILVILKFFISDQVFAVKSMKFDVKCALVGCST